MLTRRVYNLRNYIYTAQNLKFGMYKVKGNFKDVSKVFKNMNSSKMDHDLEKSKNSKR